MNLYLVEIETSDGGGNAFIVFENTVHEVAALIIKALD